MSPIARYITKTTVCLVLLFCFCDEKRSYFISNLVGPDKIPVKCLKTVELICVPLALKFNKLLRMGLFPDKWKVTRVASKV